VIVFATRAEIFLLYYRRYVVVVLIYVVLVLLAVVVDAALCIDVNKAFEQHNPLQCIGMINQLEEWTHIIEHLLECGVRLMSS